MDQTITRLNRKLYDMSKLLQAVRAFDNLLCIEDVYQIFSGIVKERVGFETCALFIMDINKRGYRLLAGDGLPIDLSFPCEDDSFRESIARGKPFHSADESNWALPQTHLFVPLIQKGDVIGFFSIDKKEKEKESLTEEDLEFIAVLAERAAVSLTTAP